VPEVPSEVRAVTGRAERRKEGEATPCLLQGLVEIVQTVKYVSELGVYTPNPDRVRIRD
jgi:hypothetical protein